jgi:hypothetical protein
MSDGKQEEKLTKRQEFMKKVQALSLEASDKSLTSGREQLINDELKIETLLFLKSQIAAEESLSNLKLIAARKLIEMVEDDDGEVSPMTLVKIIETIGRIENDKASNILGVLKQQIVIQQNVQQNFPNGAVPPEKVVNDDDQLSKDDFRKVRKVYDFVNKLKQAEMNEQENREEKEVK